MVMQILYILTEKIKSLVFSKNQANNYIVKLKLFSKYYKILTGLFLIYHINYATNTSYIYDKTYKHKGGCDGEKFF